MMLVWVLVLTALLASDVAGLEVPQRGLDKRELCNGPCDENWFYFPDVNACYRFFSDQKTWSDAEARCNQHRHFGHLASMSSTNHNAFISNVIDAVNKSKPAAWIGLNGKIQKGIYRWIDGSSWSYRKWGPGEPNDMKGNEECVDMNYFHDGAWNDESCDLKRPFVCSYKVRCG